MHVTCTLEDSVVVARWELITDGLNGWVCQFTDLHTGKQCTCKLTSAQFGAVLAMAVQNEDSIVGPESAFIDAAKLLAEIAMKESPVRPFP